MPALVPGMVERRTGGLARIRHEVVSAKSLRRQSNWPTVSRLTRCERSYLAGSRAFFDLWPTSKAHFLPGGKLPLPGEIFRQPDTARTLRAMAEAEKKALAVGSSRAAAIDAVRDYFYRGEIARKIDAFSKANGGLLRYEDMAAFKLELKNPLARRIAASASTSLASGARVRPCSGAEHPGGLRRASSGYNSAELDPSPWMEALKLAYADRDTYYGDPKFNQIPSGALLSKEYADERRAQIGKTRFAGLPPGAINGREAGAHPRPRRSRRM